MKTTNQTITDMTPEQLKAQHEELMKQVRAIQKVCPELSSLKKSNRILKITDKGGIYLVDPSFVAYSEKKKKNYIAGVNMNKAVFKALFSNPEIVALCQEFVNSEEYDNTAETEFYNSPAADTATTEAA